METRDDDVGPWSEQKLKLLQKYLRAYVQILSKQEWCKGYEYIDAFAGSGKPKSRDEQRYVDGSPRVALGLTPAFTRYHFIELSDWRRKKLEALVAEFSNREVRIYGGDCNEALQNRIVPQLSESSFRRAIAFLDPFGMQLEWETLEAMAKVKTIEVLLNFPVMAINRNVRRRHPQSIPVSLVDAMNRFWGTEEWRAELFESVPTLFGEETVRVKQSGIELGERFRKRLKTVYPHTTSPLLMANSKNAPLYCLMFAGHKATGARIVEQIFGRFLTLG